MAHPLGSGSSLQTAGPLTDTSHKNTGAAREPGGRGSSPRLPTVGAPAPALWTLSSSGEEEGPARASLGLLLSETPLQKHEHPPSASQSKKENHSFPLRKATEKFTSCKCFLYKSQIPELI